MEVRHIYLTCLPTITHDLVGLFRHRSTHSYGYLSNYNKMCFRSKFDQEQEDLPQEPPKVIVTRTSTERAAYGDFDSTTLLNYQNRPVQRPVGKRKPHQTVQQALAERRLYDT